MQEICERISRVYSSELEKSVQRFLESLGKLRRGYLTSVEEKLLSVIENIDNSKRVAKYQIPL